MIVTAGEIGSYQPGRAHFDEARRRPCGIANSKSQIKNLRSEICHCERSEQPAQGYFHDIRPALEFNIPVAWINRKSETLPGGLPKPLYVVSDLNELADQL